MEKWTKMKPNTKKNGETATKWDIISNQLKSFWLKLTTTQPKLKFQSKFQLGFNQKCKICLDHMQELMKIRKVCSRTKKGKMAYHIQNLIKEASSHKIYLLDEGYKQLVLTTTLEILSLLNYFHYYPNLAGNSILPNPLSSLKWFLMKHQCSWSTTSSKESSIAAEASETIWSGFDTSNKRFPQLGMTAETVIIAQLKWENIQCYAKPQKKAIH